MGQWYLLNTAAILVSKCGKQALLSKDSRPRIPPKQKSRWAILQTTLSDKNWMRRSAAAHTAICDAVYECLSPLDDQFGTNFRSEMADQSTDEIVEHISEDQA